MGVEVNGIAHIQLTVNDPAKCLPFWERLCHFLEMKTLVKNDPTLYCIGSRTGILIREAPEAEAYGLQDCYFAPGIMKFEIDLTAPVSTWEEAKEAIVILAENAVRGFVQVSLAGEPAEFYQAAGKCDEAARILKCVLPECTREPLQSRQSY